MYNIVLFGPPGSGKSSQIRRLQDKFGVPAFSTGRTLRAHIEDKTSLGREFEKRLKKGNLVPDELILKMIEEKLSENEYKNGYILDGAPRTLKQAKELDKITNVTHVIYIKVDNKIIRERLIERLSCKNCGFTTPEREIKGEKVCPKCNNELVKRDDDSKKVIENRIKVYEKHEKGILDYYKKKGVLYTIEDYGETVDAIYEKMIGALS